MDIADNQIADEGAKALAAVIENPRRSRSLASAATKSQTWAPRRWRPLLRKSASFHTIGLNGNQITDVGATAMAAAIVKSTSLQTIWLNDNQITDLGTKALAAAIPRARIQNLYIFGNSRLKSAGETAH